MGEAEAVEAATRPTQAQEAVRDQDQEVMGEPEHQGPLSFGHREFLPGQTTFPQQTLLPTEL